MFKKISYLIIMLLLVIPGYTFAYSDYIIASGENIGIKIKSNGIIIIDRYNDINPSLEKGDIITSINNIKDLNIEKFTNIISKENINSFKIGYIRDGKFKETILNVEDGKTGLYLKDTIAGIGTLTFIDPDTKIYGALGHEIVDSISGNIIDIKNGNIYDSKVIDITRSSNGIPGEKNASINSELNKGDIDTNTNKGLFGDYQGNIDNNSLYKVGTTKDIKKGKAYILTELEDNEIKKYEIYITKINTNGKVKNITFKITDERLLEIGGIVQGMSGSPIIQGDYIVGAVTHVVVENPKKGYGILITNMLEEAEKKDE